MPHISQNGLRRQLVALGYKIIPNKGKIPAIKGWNSEDFPARELGRTDGWDKRFDAPTTGVRVEGGLCVIDIDVDDPLVDELTAAIARIAPNVGLYAPTRFGGGKHKMALFCRTNDAFVRVASRRQGGHCVEIFGGARLRNGNCSRQFGIFGPHSFNEDGSVAAEYVWCDGPPQLLETPIAELPPLSRAQALEICGAFEALASKAGWPAEERPATDHSSAVYDIGEATRFDTDRAGRGISYVELAEAWEAIGNFRCASSFMVGREGKDTSRCWVFWHEKRECVAVYVYGDEATHYPKQLAPQDNGPDEPLPTGTTREDYYAFLPTHQYIYKYTGRLYPLATINATLNKVTIGSKNKKQSKKQVKVGSEPEVVAVQIPASLWLDRNRPVMEMSWAPGEPQLIEGKLANEGGWIERAGVATFNLYQAPALSAVTGDAVRWLLLVRKIYPAHAEHIICFCAHRIQRPAEKINHALVLTGSPGIGKDTLLEPLKHGVGPWNFREVSPQNIMDKHNDFVRSVVLRVSEARDLGEVNRYAMYEAMKTLTAAPPDMLRVDVKYVPQYYVMNVTAVIVTTNYPSDGLYLPADDRRHYVCGTEVTKDDFSPAYWAEIWSWYAAGGLADVVEYLRNYDLSGFDAKRPPEKTDAFWRMVDAGRAAEVPEISDALEAAGNPDAVTVGKIAACGSHDLRSWLNDVRNRRAVPHRMESCGYVPVRNGSGKDGYWEIGGKRQVVYCKRELSPGERYRSAEELVISSRDKKDDEKGNVTPFGPIKSR